MRAEFRLIAVVALAMLIVQAGDGASPVSPSRQAPDPNFFPIAVWYGGGKARAPMLEPINATSAEHWGHDLDQIQAVGFNTVKTWVDWATAEPQPGQFHFEQLDLLLRLAQERGLRVVVQMYLDSAPDWVGQKFPDAKFVDRSGAVIESQAAPGFCIDHPGVRAEVEKFLTEVARHANRYSALYAWDVWSEPHVINWAEFPYLPAAEFCYCPNSQRRFRTWLQKKYGTLDGLNKAWYRNFTAWEQVSPPRASTILSYTDYLDWRAFITDKIAGDLKTRVDAVRAGDSQHFITSHAAVPSLFTSPMNGYGEPDDFQMASIADFFGTSIYPKHAGSTRPWPWQQLSAALDFERSAGLSSGKPFWIGELQAGQGVSGMRIQVPVTAQDEENWLWSMLAHGAKQVAVYAWYPMSSGYESGGYGLVDLDGTLTDRARVAGKVAHIIASNARQLTAAQPAKAEVAVLYNRLSYMVGGTQPSLSRLGNAVRDSLMGLHRIFAEDQIPVDFVSAQDAIAGRMHDYKVVFLPFPVMMSRDVADAIRIYVQNGGTAIAEARLGWNDERGYASDVIPGFGLDEVFGARESEIRPVDTATFLAGPAAFPGVMAQMTASGEGFEELLRPAANTKVIAHFENGEPAIVANDFGRGHAILIGGFPAMQIQRHPEQAGTRAWLLALAKTAGVQASVPPFDVNYNPQQPRSRSGSSMEVDEIRLPGLSASYDMPAAIEVRQLAGKGYRYVFVFNHGDQPNSERIDVDCDFAPTEVRDVITGGQLEVQTNGTHVLLTKKIQAGGVWVVRISAADGKK